MPGVGVRTGARILLEVGDGSVFASAGHLASYAGIAPVTHRSGSSIRGEHPARSGNHELKRALFLSAFAALHDPASRAYYTRKRDEGKKHNAALICLARRRCDVLYTMLKTKQPYRDSRPATARVSTRTRSYTYARSPQAVRPPRKDRSWNRHPSKTNRFCAPQCGC